MCVKIKQGEDGVAVKEECENAEMKLISLRDSRRGNSRLRSPETSRPGRKSDPRKKKNQNDSLSCRLGLQKCFVWCRMLWAAFQKMQKSPRKPQMASMMHTCVGFVGLKWAHKQEIHKFPTFFKISKGPKVTKVPHFLAAWGSKRWLFCVKLCDPLFRNVLPTAARSTCLQNRVNIL